MPADMPTSASSSIPKTFAAGRGAPQTRTAGQVPSSNFQFRGVKKNGETIYLEVYGAVIDV